MPDANWKALRRSLKSASKTAPQKREEAIGRQKIAFHLTNVAADSPAMLVANSCIEMDISATDQQQLVSLLHLFPYYGAESKFQMNFLFTIRDAGKYIAMDCEMVGVGPHGIRSMLARVSVINYYGHVLLDTYVQPLERVTDYREEITGIKPWHLTKKGEPFNQVIAKVNSLLNDRIVVGHGLSNDFKVSVVHLFPSRF